MKELLNRIRAQWALLRARGAAIRDRAADNWSRLSQRDQKLAAWFGGVAAVLLILGIAWACNTRITRLHADIGTRAKQLEQVRDMRTEFKASKERLDSLSNRLKSNSAPPKSFLEERAREVNVAGSIQSMEDRAAPPNDLFKAQVIEVKIKKISVANLTRYIHKIEAAGAGMTVRRIEIVPHYQDNKYLDAKMQVLSLRPKES